MSSDASLPWYRQLTAYHWFVFAVASAAWFFDCLDQRLFSLARVPALEELTATVEGADVQALGKEVTAIFLVGWGIGGLIFGALGDRFGRAKMLTLTVFIYSICTGANFFSHAVWDFALFRFLTGVGVGGVFGLAVALIAETVPNGARAGALAMLQILSVVGNITAVGVKSIIDNLENSGTITAGDGWRWMFLVGAIPAALVVLTQFFLKEPEPWLRAKEAGTLPKGALLAPYAGLLRDTQWRRNLIVGAVLASTGVIGLWAIGEFTTDLQRVVFSQHYEEVNAANLEQGLPAIDVAAEVKSARNTAFLLQMLGAAIGMWVFAKIAEFMGRRTAFALAFISAFFITAGGYWILSSPMHAYIIMPLMFGTQLGMFSLYAIYLPELFPSRLRSTGTSFCYNLGRFGAAAGGLTSAWISTAMFGDLASPTKERYAAIIMCSIYLIGLSALPFAPETKDKPLPE
ncbi:MFS transporter [Aeoliella mucimassa]|uniref:Sialic acid transporter n=1 Tax=Aeoliella mucimassa TaxID=2527972 RepID=A0A518AJ80_9BACT|nr:MFS transporter [Aeoliella mucimassa]QDU54783.1 Putative sialic acid transporter [Aeoliella mucimassa]